MSGQRNCPYCKGSGWLVRARRRCSCTRLGSDRARLAAEYALRSAIRLRDNGQVGWGDVGFGAAIRIAHELGIEDVQRRAGLTDSQWNQVMARGGIR